VEEGRVLLGQVLWNMRFLHFGPQNLLRSPPWHVHQEDARKWPSFLVLSLLFPARPLCRVQCARCTQLPTPGSEPLTWGSGEGGRDESLARHLCLQVRPLGTSPTHTSRSPGRSRKPPCHPLGGPRGGVDSMACLRWGICVLALGLHLLAGVLQGRGTAHSLSLVLVGTWTWGRVFMPGLR
jgi:hypothetical protein